MEKPALEGVENDQTAFGEVYELLTLAGQLRAASMEGTVSSNGSARPPTARTSNMTSTTDFIILDLTETLWNEEFVAFVAQLTRRQPAATQESPWSGCTSKQALYLT